MKSINKNTVVIVLGAIVFVVAMFIMNTVINNNKIEQVQSIIQADATLKQIVENEYCSIRLSKTSVEDEVNFVAFCDTGEFRQTDIKSGTIKSSFAQTIFKDKPYIDFSSQ